LSRISLAFRSFFGILFGRGLPAEAASSLGLEKKKTAPPPAVAKPADGAAQLLGLLQREARLVDFLAEDIQSYTDEQVGAAVRPIHDQCRQALERLVKLAPVIDGVEGTYSRIGSVEPAAIKLMGKVPPGGKVEGGTLRHRGWRAEKVNLPPIGRGENTAILAPAEIEVE